MNRSGREASVLWLADYDGETTAVLPPAANAANFTAMENPEE
jgi:hypothetical protein